MNPRPCRVAGIVACLILLAVAVAAPVSVGRPAAGGALYANPVLPGDRPDPSIIRAGATYWAVTTAAADAPLMPILSSPDLVHWSRSGSVLDAPPAWAAGDGRYWAPEITVHRGSWRVYYAARRRAGAMCVASATSATPQGPYRDDGPLVCQPDGSIDPTVAVEGRRRYLIWKEDGNSRHRPTRIWAQRLAPATGRPGAPAAHCCATARPGRAGWSRRPRSSATPGASTSSTRATRAAGPGAATRWGSPAPATSWAPGGATRATRCSPATCYGAAPAT